MAASTPNSGCVAGHTGTANAGVAIIAARISIRSIPEKKYRDVLEASMSEHSGADIRNEDLYGDMIAYGGADERHLVIRRQLIGSAVVGIGVALFAALAELRPASMDERAAAPHPLWAVQQPVFAQPIEEHLAGLKR
jgi:hypothetical protein